MLVTGAGFSAGCTDQDGVGLPVGTRLAEEIWPIAFSGTYESDNPLGEIFRVARRQNGGLLKEHLERVFTVNPATLPQRYLTWFALPWYRIYTLNIDNLDEVVEGRARGGRGLQCLSALTSTPGDIKTTTLPIVHLNGKLSEYPNLTFDPLDYGKRTAVSDPWLQQFVADVVTRPVIFVGTQLDEPPLWHYLAQRGVRGASTENRPKSWFVTKTLSSSRRELLNELNIAQVEGYESDFFGEVILPDIKFYEQSSSASRALELNASYLHDVADVIATNPKGEASFLMGSEPKWGDVFDGFSVEFDSDRALLKKIDERIDGGVVLHGTAGSGKTTTLMRLSNILVAQGNKVIWVSIDETNSSPREIRVAIVHQDADYIVVDNVDRLGESARAFMTALPGENPGAVVLAALRTNRLIQLGLDASLRGFEVIGTPMLSDDDATRLVESLARGHRLGALLRHSKQERIKFFTKRADRQLLVGLIEATSGRSFHSKVADECSELRDIALVAYGTLCIVKAVDDQSLSADDVLISVDQANNDGLKAIRQLVQGGLVREQREYLMPRHRVVAESSVQYFRDAGLLPKMTAALMFLFAVKYSAADMTRGRYGKLLIRFLNHDFLRAFLGSATDVQNVFGQLESVLSGEFHFWLQRGSFELESGDPNHAETYLRQAQALKEDDVKVETAWCYLLLKRALEGPVSSGSSNDAAEALHRLEAVLAAHPSSTPHTYDIYLRLGLRWLHMGALTRREKLDLLERLESRAKAGLAGFRAEDRIVRSAGAVLRARYDASLGLDIDAPDQMPGAN